MSKGLRWAGALVVALMAVGWAGAEAPVRASKIVIITSMRGTAAELKAAEMLKSRILKRSAVTVETVPEDKVEARHGSADVVFIVGVPRGGEVDLVTKLMDEKGMRLPTLPNTDTPHPEGFAVKSGKMDNHVEVVIAGADERGTIYGVGHVLRAMTYLPDAALVPEMDVQDKPAFAIRGGRPTGPGSRARQFGNLREQTKEEQLEVMEDLMLLGCNTFEGEPEFIRSYGMMTYFGRTANEMPPGFPPEWRADGGRLAKYVCPSIPEAREALLKSFEEQFSRMPAYDFFTTNSGDEGGCRCEKCMPWGDKYIRLVHDIADILHKYHPNTKVQATNQDLTHEGDQAIFDYLNEGDSSWLFALRYGPGADRMQKYIRGPVDPRFFVYEGFGPLGNYLKWAQHELPRETDIVLYSDITHWMQAQYAVEKPDLALAAVYDRRSWNARPRAFHRVGQEILHYALGDMHYSEGMHDDFNKWFWYRLLWNPEQSAEAITEGYCRYWFGPAAAESISAAIFTMEENLEKPVLGNEGIARAVEQLHDGGQQIPANLLKSDYRWRIMMEKALMDRYIQLMLQRGEELKAEAARLLAAAEKGSQPAADVTRAVEILEQPIETDEMKAVMDEALQRGEESNATIGYREPAPFLVRDLDLPEVQWWVKTLRQALEAGDEGKIRNAVRMVLRYDDPGEGGIYEDFGWPNESSHLTRGEALWGFMPFPGPAKRSHYNLAYTFGRGGEGVSMKYNVNPGAQYVVRLSVGAHLDEENSPLKDAKLSEGLVADGQVISEGFPVPMGDVLFHEFDLPQEVTQDGVVELSLTPGSPALPVTALYEIWLLVKGNEPWTARP